MNLKKNFIIILISVMVCACGDTPKLKMEHVSSYVYQNKILNSAQQAKVQELFSTLRQTRYSFDTKPDAFLMGYDPTQCRQVIYSIYLKKKLVYVGWYLNAWTDDMQDKSSVCYKLSSKAKKYLLEIENKTRNDHYYNIKFPLKMDKAKVLEDFKSKGLNLQFSYGEHLDPYVTFSITSKTTIPQDTEDDWDFYEKAEKQAEKEMKQLIETISKKYAVKRSSFRTTGGGSNGSENEIDMEGTLYLNSASDLKGVQFMITDLKGTFLSADKADFYYAQLKDPTASLSAIREKIRRFFPYVMGVENFISPFPVIDE